MLERKKKISPSGTVFDEISSYWTEIADAHDTEKQSNFAKRNLNSSGLILDLGCGNGRHAIQLSEASYDMIGLDVSRHLLKIALTKAAMAAVNLALVRADMRFLPFRNETFSGILSLDSTLGYFPSEKEDRQTFNEVRRTLVSAGIFLIDVFNGEHMFMRRNKINKREWLFGLSRFPQFSVLFSWCEYPSFFMFQKRRISKNKRMLQDVWIFRDKQTGKTHVVRHAIRLFTFDDLRKLLFESGLGVSKICGGYGEEEFGKDSRRLIIIANKG